MEYKEPTEDIDAVAGRPITAIPRTEDTREGADLEMEPWERSLLTKAEAIQYSNAGTAKSDREQHE